jgi:hypothetical protein
MSPQAEMQTIDPTYASALVSAPSPTSSIGSRLPDDETDPDDARLTQEEFDAKCWKTLRIDEPTAEETSAMRRPLYHTSHRMDPEQAGRSVQLITWNASDLGLDYTAGFVPSFMQNLRTEIKKLQDNELFEQVFSKALRLGRTASPQPETSTPSCRAC